MFFLRNTPKGQTLKLDWAGEVVIVKPPSTCSQEMTDDLRQHPLFCLKGYFQQQKGNPTVIRYTTEASVRPQQHVAAAPHLPATHHVHGACLNSLARRRALRLHAQLNRKCCSDPWHHLYILATLASRHRHLPRWKKPRLSWYGCIRQQHIA